MNRESPLIGDYKPFRDDSLVNYDEDELSTRLKKAQTDEKGVSFSLPDKVPCFDDSFLFEFEKWHLLGIMQYTKNFVSKVFPLRFFRDFLKRFAGIFCR